jgi:hypothetical protein
MGVLEARAGLEVGKGEAGEVAVVEGEDEAVAGRVGDETADAAGGQDASERLAGLEIEEDHRAVGDFGDELAAIIEEGDRPDEGWAHAQLLNGLLGGEVPEDDVAGAIAAGQALAGGIEGQAVDAGLVAGEVELDLAGLSVAH